MFSDLLQNELKRIKLPKFDVSDTAPSTFKDLIQHFSSTKRLLVWSGASERTIWGPNASNWLFRAWHDYSHILGSYDFTLQGEFLTAKLQMSQVESTFLQKLVNIEVNEQANYFKLNGVFPVNQIEFFKGKLK